MNAQVQHFKRTWPSTLNDHWKRKPWLAHGFHSKNDLEKRHTESHQSKVRLSQALLGPNCGNDQYFDVFFAFLRAQLIEFDEEPERTSRSFASILNLPSPCELDVFLNDVLDLIIDFLSVIPDIKDKKMNLEDVCDVVLQKRGKTLKCLDPASKHNALQAVFAISGWHTMLYEPSKTIQPGNPPQALKSLHVRGTSAALED
ncbi:hypothetical protein ACLMJK_001862 [Lecanora helva]